MKRHLIGASIICLLFASSPGIAQEDRAAAAKERMEETRARLNLSDEQVEALTPVLKESMTAQQSILSKYGVNLEGGSNGGQQLGLREARAMKKELDFVRTETLDTVDDILTDEQFDEFKRIQEERRAEMRQRIRARR